MQYTQGFLGRAGVGLRQESLEVGVGIVQHGLDTGVGTYLQYRGSAPLTWRLEADYLDGGLALGVNAALGPEQTSMTPTVGWRHSELGNAFLLGIRWGGSLDR